MKTKNNLFISVIIIAFLSLLSCEKEEIIAVDYRDKYLGEFNFTIIKELWIGGLPATYDTSNYKGIIRKYEYNDSIMDLCVLTNNPIGDFDSKITIEFLDNNLITSILSKDGILTGKSGYHYYHHGYYLNSDTILFTVGDLGGLGYRYSFEVTGIKD